MGFAANVFEEVDPGGTGKGDRALRRSLVYFHDDDTADADPVHRLQVGSDPVAVDVAVQPEPKNRRSRRSGRTGEARLEISEVGREYLGAAYKNGAENGQPTKGIPAVSHFATKRLKAFQIINSWQTLSGSDRGCTIFHLNREAALEEKNSFGLAGGFDRVVALCGDGDERGCNLIVQALENDSLDRLSVSQFLGEYPNLSMFEQALG